LGSSNISIDPSSLPDFVFAHIFNLDKDETKEDKIDESDFRFAHSHMCMVKCDVYGNEADTYFEGRNVMPVSVFTCKV
jgi:hypothetical protein